MPKNAIANITGSPIDSNNRERLKPEAANFFEALFRMKSLRAYS